MVPLAAKTIFQKGKASITHNNRIICNKCGAGKNKLGYRITLQESIKGAYEKCFGQALVIIMRRKKRKDRGRRKII